MDIIAKETVTYSETEDDFDRIENSLNSLLSSAESR